MRSLSEIRDLQGHRLALVIACLVTPMVAGYSLALKAYPAALPGPVALFFMTVVLGGTVFALVSIKLVWLYDPAVHRRHFGMMALAVPLHYFFFTGILGSYLDGFLPTLSWLVFLVFGFLSAYGGASIGALAVIHRAKLRPNHTKSR